MVHFSPALTVTLMGLYIASATSLPSPSPYRNNDNSNSNTNINTNSNTNANSNRFRGYGYPPAEGEDVSELDKRVANNVIIGEKTRIVRPAGYVAAYPPNTVVTGKVTPIIVPGDEQQDQATDLTKRNGNSNFNQNTNINQNSNINANRFRGYGYGPRRYGGYRGFGPPEEEVEQDELVQEDAELNKRNYYPGNGGSNGNENSNFNSNTNINENQNQNQNQDRFRGGRYGGYGRYGPPEEDEQEFQNEEEAEDLAKRNYYPGNANGNSNSNFNQNSNTNINQNQNQNLNRFRGYGYGPRRYGGYRGYGPPEEEEELGGKEEEDSEQLEKRGIYRPIRYGYPTRRYGYYRTFGYPSQGEEVVQDVDAEKQQEGEQEDSEQQAGLEKRGYYRTYRYGNPGFYRFNRYRTFGYPPQDAEDVDVSAQPEQDGAEDEEQQANLEKRGYYRTYRYGNPAIYRYNRYRTFGYPPQDSEDGSAQQGEENEQQVDLEKRGLYTPIRYGYGYPRRFGYYRNFRAGYPPQAQGDEDAVEEISDEQQETVEESEEQAGLEKRGYYRTYRYGNPGFYRYNRYRTFGYPPQGAEEDASVQNADADADADEQQQENSEQLEKRGYFRPIRYGYGYPSRRYGYYRTGTAAGFPPAEGEQEEEEEENVDQTNTNSVEKRNYIPYSYGYGYPRRFGAYRNFRYAFPPTGSEDSAAEQQVNTQQEDTEDTTSGVEKRAYFRTGTVGYPARRVAYYRNYRYGFPPFESEQEQGMEQEEEELGVEGQQVEVEEEGKVKSD